MPIVPSRIVVDGLEGVGRSKNEDEARARMLDPDLVSAAELDYLDQLAGLLGGNPRSLKRFVNTYRLVKTALSDVELASFLRPASTSAGRYLPYRICMAQLAVLCTQRNRALCLIRHADSATPETGLTQWLADFKKIDADLADRFQAALEQDLKGTDLRTFQHWLERTRRYSFYL